MKQRGMSGHLPKPPATPMSKALKSKMRELRRKSNPIPERKNSKRLNPGNNE